MTEVSRFTAGLRRADTPEFNPNSTELHMHPPTINIDLSMLEQDYTKAIWAYRPLLFNNLEFKSATFGAQGKNWFVIQL
jgi:hypothetical protein